ncbi:adenylate/guanylate cyclase domain-containing protein [Paenibacillus sp. BC26]|uniref:adenylate/guanylate cyclase domain-containing protein n=1 Tax=Paenibacillus sp. BC26 TaxID=1881032 RepID=UPI0008DEC555|nr:adenylate/guanylate cyclase domain-containing protein [Paenibacillus sp. BC26]SFS59966.1 Adenylate cyclase, class 3 [Paenibacillus sp. BC26]
MNQQKPIKSSNRSSYPRLWLTILLCGLLGLSVYLFLHRNELTRNPTKDATALSNLSAIAPGNNGDVYVISDAKQQIQAIDSDGKLKYRIKQSSNNRGNFSELAVDEQGRVYTINTVLDQYGLYVESEEIVRYTEEGKFDKQLFMWKGDQTSKRIGQLRALQIKDNLLTFYISKANEVQQKQLSLDNGKWTQPFAFKLPPNRYLSEVYGTEPGSIYFTTKRGAIYEVAADGTSKSLYPVAGMEKTRKNFPERLKLDGNGNIMFIDRSINALTKLSPNTANPITLLLEEPALSAAVPEAESLELADYSLHADGSIELLLADRLMKQSSNGAVTPSFAQLHFSNQERTQQWLVWSAAAAGLLVLTASARLVYIHIMRRRISFFLKQMVVFVPLVTVSMVLLSNSIYDGFSGKMEEEMKRELSVLAQSGKYIIDGDRLEKLTSPNDFMSADYQEIKKRMNVLFQHDNSIDRRGLYSTVYKYENGKLYIIADDDDGVNMFKPFPLSEDNLPVVEQGQVMSGSWVDANGQWTYAIAPVYNSKGDIVGIYETGRDLNVLRAENATINQTIFKNITIITVLILLVFMLSSYFLLASLRKLRKSVTDITNGNWDAEVHIRSRDEVADLGEQFNLMVRHIRQYISDITAFSEASFRFVPQQVFKYLGKRGILDVHLGDQVQQNMVVMVTKLRQFYEMSKGLTPKENFNFMNSFLSRFGPLVRKENGLISNYLGAGFMTLFPSRTEDAIKAAIAIRKELLVYNGHRAKVNYIPVEIGIAIHKGPLMLGIIGEETKMESNVISDDVTLTSRLEELSETLGVSILVTRSALESMEAPERFQFRWLGRVHIEGNPDPIELYDVYEGDTEALRSGKDKTKKLFERGIQLYQEGRFFDARETFVEVIKWNRLDKTAKLYFYLCDEYFQRGTAVDWNGTLAVS